MRPSPFWAKKLRAKEAILAKDPTALADFRQNGLADWIDAASVNLKGERRVHMHTNKAWGVMGQFIKPEFLPLVNEIPAGNPLTTLVLGDIRATPGSIEFAYFVSLLSLRIKPGMSVCEIGGGYGGLARALLTAIPSIEYTLVDFPVMLEIQNYYLKGAGFKVHTLIPGERLPSADLYINCKSMFEMTIEQIDFYLKQMHEVPSNGVFFSVNKDKITQLADWPIPKSWVNIMDQELAHSGYQRNYRAQMWRIE